jgi:hypothetical protein
MSRHINQTLPGMPTAAAGMLGAAGTLLHTPGACAPIRGGIMANQGLANQAGE